MIDRLPVSAGEKTLSRLIDHGWIECRGDKQHTGAKLTPAGLKARRSRIRSRSVAEGERENQSLSRPISVKGVGDKDAGAKNYKKRCYNFEHGAALAE